MTPGERLLAPADAEQIEAARNFDAMLLALEGFALSGLTMEERLVQRAVMLQAYATRIGVTIVDYPEAEAALIAQAEANIRNAAAIIKMLRA